MNTQYKSPVYNDLIDVSDSSARIEELGGDNFVGNFLSIIAEEGLAHRIGLRLLHKHNDITDDEIMCETLQADEEGPALVTTAVKRSSNVDCTVNSWRFLNNKMVPVEFSDADLLFDDIDSTALNNLFEKLGKALVDADASDLLGPCVNYAPTVTSLAPNQNSAFLEKTDIKTRSNIVRYVDRESVDFTVSVKTKWLAIRATDEGGEPAWITACTCFCAVFPEGGHQGTTYHRLQKSSGETGPMTKKMVN